MALVFEVQKAIIDKLKSDILDLRIENFNKIFDDFLAPGIKGKVSVEYQTGKFLEPDNYYKIHQLKEMNWKISLVCRNFPDITEENYTYIEKIMDCLTGFTYGNCSKLYPINDGLKKTKDMKYYYEIIFINKINYFEV